MDDMVRVCLYARVSSQRQADELTIQSQVAALRQRIGQEGLVLDEELCFLDEGYSGATLRRPALERLRDVVYFGGIDRLYVHSPDRLARKYAYQFLLLEELKKHDVEVVFLNHDSQNQSPEGNLLLQMQGMIAEYERAKILERTRRGRRFAARQGKVSAIAHAPYGYRYVSKHQGDGEASYGIVLDEARVVKEIFGWVGVEGLSLGKVVDRLAERGVPTATGKPRWDRSTVHGILRQPAYTGTAKYPKTRLFPRKSGRRPKRGDPPIPRRSRSPRSSAESCLTPWPRSSKRTAAGTENRRKGRSSCSAACWCVIAVARPTAAGEAEEPTTASGTSTTVAWAPTATATGAKRSAPTKASTAGRWKNRYGRTSVRC